MALGILTISGFLGFVSAVLAGLMLGLTPLGAIGVYCLAGSISALTIFSARGLFCVAARQFA